MKSLFYLNKYLYKYKLRLFLGIVFITVSNYFAVLPPQYVREAMNLIGEHVKDFQANSTDTNLSFIYYQLLKYTALIIIMSLLNGFFTFLKRQAIIIMSREIEFDLKNEIYTHYQLLDPAFYKLNNTGDIMNRVSEDVSKVRMYLGPAVMYTIDLVVRFILIVGTMLTISPELTAYSLLPLPFLAILIYKVSSIINERSGEVQTHLSKLFTISQETFAGIRLIKSFVKENSQLGKFKKESDAYKNSSLKLVKTNALFFPIMLLLIGLSTVLTIYIGGTVYISGNTDITIGNIAEFVIYINMLTWPVTSIGWVTSLVQEAAASQSRINEFLNTKPTLKEKSDARKWNSGDLTFDKVSFTYPESGIQALKNISFTIKKGETLGIMGHTGSGKSTIANLIPRLFDTDSGNIKINNISIKDLRIKDLRSKIGLVPQDVFLFSDTIANNIRFGSHKELNNHELREVAKQASILSNIEDFPKQFETKIGERGIMLSGGQKQRLSIARAIVDKPEILIFDDCLSAVDTETENSILENLKQLMKGTTSVIISHRISSVMHATNIIVLENGEISEYGKHKDLIDKKGIYFDLYTKQLTEKDEKN